MTTASVTLGNEMEMARFAADVLTIAQRMLAGVIPAGQHSAIGCFGDRKVFINHIAAALGIAGAENLGLFKACLVEANRRALLNLSRADLVEVMNAADVRASCIEHLGTTFHFVRID